MTRVNRGFKARKRRKKILKMASGYYGTRHRLFKTAKETVEKALCYAYRDRKTKKREFKKLWIIKINAMCRMHNLNYSLFINKLKNKNIKLNRFILSEIIKTNPKDFEKIIKCLK